MDTHTNTHSPTNLQAYLGLFVLFIIIAAKVAIASCIFVRECVSISASMDVATQLESCFHEQTQIVANAACILGS